MMTPTVYIPISALFCYSFLMVTVVAAKKNKVLMSFIVLLCAFILWTAGSLFMRLQFYPGVHFWFEVSIFGLLVLPFMYYNFVYHFVEAKGYFLRLTWGIITLVLVVLNWFHIFISPPQVVSLGDGKVNFVYELGVLVVIPSIFTALVIISILHMIFSEARKKEANVYRFMPIILGAMILFIGNVAVALPWFSGTPIDTLAGVINALFIFYALYKRRLFNLTLIASQGTTYIVILAFVTLFFSYFIRPLEIFFAAKFPMLVTQTTLFITLFFALLLILFHRLTRRVSDQIFERKDQEHAAILKEFSTTTAKSLNLDEILEIIADTAKRGVMAEKIYICIPDDTGTVLKIAHSTSPLDVRTFQMPGDNPYVEWLTQHNSTVLVKDFHFKAAFKAMWASEKKQLAELGIECFVPLKYEEQLVGIMLLTKKHKNRSYSHSDISFLDSIKSVGSIVIQNARLYAKAYNEARYDDLTGLLNRKYFYEAMDTVFEECKNGALGLLILNIDNFKLYNQLYGNWEGDLALRKIADIIKNSITASDIAARYSGKEFALILPGYDVMLAMELAEDIRQKVLVMNKNDDLSDIKVLTVSCGICVYPYSAAGVKELISNADMAVFNAKRSGRDRVEVYSMKETEDGGEESVFIHKPDSYESYSATIYALTAAIDVKDHYTFNHSRNVAEYATCLAKALRLNDEHVEIIREAALLHDIGKIGIPEQVLNKMEPLNSQEYEIMKKHVEHSIAMIRFLPSLDYVIPVVMGHHERWDGKGYPRNLAGENIPIGARCLAIADAFDAMTTERAYRKAKPVSFAINEIKVNAGTQFDPKLAEVFVKLVEEEHIKVG